MSAIARSLFFCLALIILLAGCAQTANKPEPANDTPVSAFDKAVTHDRVIVAGQPTRADLQSLKARGITQVFNVRTPEEMSELGFDQAALLDADGIAYSQHAIGSSAAYTPELLATFAEALNAREGKVLLHCAGGGRAGMLYAAYAMKFLGLAPDEAMRTLADVGGWPLPLERLTGEKLRVVRADAREPARE